MSPLPRLAHPRGPSARIAAMVARAPAPPAEQLSLPLLAPPAAPSTRMRGPILLQPAPLQAKGEQRIAECPRVERCVDDWLAQGREGQARCPAGCGVWLYSSGEGDER